MESLFEKLPISDRDICFDLTLVLLGDKKLSHREMAAQLCSRIVSVEKTSFKKRLPMLMPLILKQLSNNDYDAPGKFVMVHINMDTCEDENNQTNQIQRSKDHHCIQILKMISKIVEHCPIILTDVQYCHDLDNIAQYVQKLLGYSHVWVRFEAAKLLECILASLDMGMLRQNFISGSIDCDRGFIYYDTRRTLKSLVLDFCAQLIPGEITSEFAEQVIKNLIYIANFLRNIKIKSDEKTEELNDNHLKVIDLSWLIRRMRYVVHAEVAKTPSEFPLRSAVFNWVEEIVKSLPSAQLHQHAQQLLGILVREMSNMKESCTEIRVHANRVGRRIKKKIGDDDFNRFRLLAQTKLNVRRADRKKERAQEKINDPVKAAKRKINHQQKKKEFKKRKMEVMKGKRPFVKKRPRKEIIIEDN